MPLTVADASSRLVDLAVGVQLYKLDRTPLVKLSAGGTGVISPFAPDATWRAVVISTGGVRQLALAKAADCKNPRPAADCAPLITKAADAAKAAVLATK